MYCILMDGKTKSFYMEPGNLKFYAFTSPDAYMDYELHMNSDKDIRLVETEIEDYREFMTFLANAGFVYGYLDGKYIRIRKSDLLFTKQSCNEVVYAQYLLTGDDVYLKCIRKSQLCTLCSIKDDKCSVLFPTVKLEDGTSAILAYTDIKRIPVEMREKYKGWRTVRMTFDAVCIVNGKFVAV